MKKILVTGGSGYFGTTLVKELVKSNVEIIIYDLNEPESISSHVEFIQGDIRDKISLEKACNDVDIVFHNVAQVPLAKNKELFRSVNRDGTQNILNACLNNRVKKIVYTSSSAVFGIPKHNPVDEKMSPHPLEAYGKEKYEGEKLCQQYIDKGLDITIIRPRTIIGHGRLGIFQILFEWIYQGKNIPVLGKGDNQYQFIHATDLAIACINASIRQGSEIYHCGAESFGTMNDLLTELCEFSKTGAKVVHVPMRLAQYAMQLTSFLRLSPLAPYHALMYGRSLYFDIQKAKKELNWTPQYSNREMFEENYQWYVSNRATILNKQNGSSMHQSAMKQGVLKLISKVL